MSNAKTSPAFHWLLLFFQLLKWMSAVFATVVFLFLFFFCVPQKNAKDFSVLESSAVIKNTLTDKKEKTEVKIVQKTTPQEKQNSTELDSSEFSNCPSLTMNSNVAKNSALQKKTALSIDSADNRIQKIFGLFGFVLLLTLFGQICFEFALQLQDWPYFSDHFPVRPAFFWLFYSLLGLERLFSCGLAGSISVGELWGLLALFILLDTLIYFQTERFCEKILHSKTFAQLTFNGDLLFYSDVLKTEIALQDQNRESSVQKAAETVENKTLTQNRNSLVLEKREKINAVSDCKIADFNKNNEKSELVGTNESEEMGDIAETGNIAEISEFTETSEVEKTSNIAKNDKLSGINKSIGFGEFVENGENEDEDEENAELSEDFDPSVFLSMEYRREKNSLIQIIEGWVRVDFLRGEECAVVFLAFCPVFRTTPQLQTEPISGSAVSIRITQLFLSGARLEVRRTVPVSEQKQSFFPNFVNTREKEAGNFADVHKKISSEFSQNEISETIRFYFKVSETQ